MNKDTENSLVMQPGAEHLHVQGHEFDSLVLQADKGGRSRETQTDACHELR